MQLNNKLSKTATPRKFALVVLSFGLFLVIYWSLAMSMEVSQTRPSGVQLLDGRGYQIRKQAFGSQITPSCEHPMTVCNIIFVKTFKTGSTTIGSLLFRFGLRRKLKFYVLPEEYDHHIKPSHAPCSDCNISFYHAYGSRMLAPEVYKTFVPTGKFVTIVREPIARHLSDYYYHFGPSEANGTTLQGVTSVVEQGKRTFDLAKALDLNETGNPVQDAQMTIRKLDLFEVILVMERFDESLVMMKQKLNWSIMDLVHLPVNVGCGGVRPWDGRSIKCPLSRDMLNASQLERLEKLLAVDQIIYIEANRRLDDYLKHNKEQVEHDLTELRTLNDKLRQMCIEAPSSSECVLYGLGDYPGGYEKIARDCTLESHRPHGRVNFPCQASHNALVGKEWLERG